jgi:hypothetical protein
MDSKITLLYVSGFLTSLTLRYKYFVHFHSIPLHSFHPLERHSFEYIIHWIRRDGSHLRVRESKEEVCQRVCRLGKQEVEG